MAGPDAPVDPGAACDAAAGPGAAAYGAEVRVADLVVDHASGDVAQGLTSSYAGHLAPDRSVLRRRNLLGGVRVDRPGAALSYPGCWVRGESIWS